MVNRTVWNLKGFGTRWVIENTAESQSHPSLSPLHTHTSKSLFCVILPGQLCLQPGWSSRTGDSILNYFTESQSRPLAQLCCNKAKTPSTPPSLMYLVITCLSWSLHLSLRCVCVLGSGLLSISRPDCQHLITWRVEEEAELSCDMIGLKGSNWQVKHLLNYLSLEGQGKSAELYRLRIVFRNSTIYYPSKCLFLYKWMLKEELNTFCQ